MTLHVDAEPLPVCPFCKRGQPLEAGRFRTHSWVVGDAMAPECIGAGRPPFRGAIPSHLDPTVIELWPNREKP